MSKANPRAGGALLACGTVIGTLAGGFAGQPSAGLLLGLGTGAAGALLLWLMDRRG